MNTYTDLVHRELFVGSPVVATTDFDEATEAVQEVFLPHWLDLLEHDSRLDMRLNALKVGGVTAGYLRYGRDLRMVTADATNVHIDLPLTGRAWMRCGRMAPVVAGPGRGPCSPRGSLPTSAGARTPPCCA
ncbi:hypothetical protein GCM10029964_054190 [Kibdelosporangium lantanae]